MKLVGRQLLTEFMQQHADVRGPLSAWVKEVETASWSRPSDVKARYPSASFLSDNEVIFNIKGNRYRLKVLVAYATQAVVVQKVGTHADYDRW
jgi:mRNA interferase HigB